MSFLFKNDSLEEVVYLFIRCNKTGVNKQNTHTKHLEQYNTGKRSGRVPTMGASEFLFFGSAKETSNDVNFFLNLRIIKKQKPAVFLRKYYILTSSK